MTPERHAEVAQQLGERIIDLTMEQMGGQPAAEAAQVMLLAGLGAFAALVKASDGTRRGASLAVMTLLPAILADVFEDGV